MSGRVANGLSGNQGGPGVPFIIAHCPRGQRTIRYCSRGAVVALETRSQVRGRTQYGELNDVV